MSDPAPAPSLEQRKVASSSTSCSVASAPAIRKKKNRRLCSVELCDKYDDGARSNFMCRRHYRLSTEAKSEEDDDAADMKPAALASVERCGSRVEAIEPSCDNVSSQSTMSTSQNPIQGNIQELMKQHLENIQQEPTEGTTPSPLGTPSNDLVLHSNSMRVHSARATRSTRIASSGEEVPREDKVPTPSSDVSNEVAVNVVYSTTQGKNLTKRVQAILSDKSSFFEEKNSVQAASRRVSRITHIEKSIDLNPLEFLADAADSVPRVVSRASNQAPETSEEASTWVCLRCSTQNDVARKRCSSCRGWKGGIHPSNTSGSPKRKKKSQRKTSETPSSSRTIVNRSGTPKRVPAKTPFDYKSRSSPEQRPKRAATKRNYVNNDTIVNLMVNEGEIDVPVYTKKEVNTSVRAQRAKRRKVTPNETASAVPAGSSSEPEIAVTEPPPPSMWIRRANPHYSSTPVKDPSPHFCEETSWRYHNPPAPPPEGEAPISGAVREEDLQSLPPPPEIPTLPPDTEHCTWSFDPESRVLLANFCSSSDHSKPAVLSRDDEEFLVRMMDRDDITVISEGLFDDADPKLWSRKYIADVAGDEHHAKFRQFHRIQKGETVKYVEVDGYLSIRPRDYMEYLKLRQQALDDPGQNVERFDFTDQNDKPHEIDVSKVVLYMIDYDMVKLLPKLHHDLQSKFLMPTILPGGEYCMMHSITPGGRPFMGPNLYMTPPGSFTHFHQDGHGTVDSGHLCLSGYNEVIMLRRLPERHKLNALRILNGGQAGYNPLYEEPHRDNLGDKPDWATTAAVEECKSMQYCPSVFILKPGQHVHINKGRIHAFRKMSRDTLPNDDCHATLRNELIHAENLTARGEDVCVSVAWDWRYIGSTSAAINRESVATLECATLNQMRDLASLGVPEFELFQLAKSLLADHGASNPSSRQSLFGSLIPKPRQGSALPSTVDIMKGILPSLRYVIGLHEEAESEARDRVFGAVTSRGRVRIAKRPDTWENPETFSLDPYGSSDFVCKICNAELSNVYMHCEGCEIILSKDFNICVDCHGSKRYAAFFQMHPLNKKRHSTINHTGNYHMDRVSRCPCKNGPVCQRCKHCAGCSCRCHTHFELHHRFFGMNYAKQLLNRIEKAVSCEDIEYAEEVKPRLEVVRNMLKDIRCPLTVAPQAPSNADEGIAAEISSVERVEKVERTGEEEFQTVRCQEQIPTETPTNADRGASESAEANGESPLTASFSTAQNVANSVEAANEYATAEEMDETDI